MTGRRGDTETEERGDGDDYSLMVDGTDAEWFAASGHCGGCGMFVAEAGKRYDPAAGNEYGPFRYCECGPGECGCGPHPRPDWIIPGEQPLAIQVSS